MFFFKNNKCYAGMNYKINKKKYKIPKTLIFTDEQKHIHQDVLDGLYNLLKLTNTLFKDNHIQYFAIAGTLISAIRHKSFMPWDDDIDMGYFLEEHKKIQSLKIVLLAYGYNLLECSPGFVIQKITNPKISMDLFMITKYKSTNEYKYCAPIDIKTNKPTFLASTYWPKEIFFENELYNLQEIKFCDITIFVPYDSENILKRQYSPNVMNEVRGVASTKSHILRPVQICFPLIEKIFGHTKIAKKMAKKVLM